MLLLLIRQGSAPDSSKNNTFRNSSYLCCANTWEDMALSRQMFESCHFSSFVYIGAKSNHASISNFWDSTCQDQVDNEQRENTKFLLNFNKNEGGATPYKWSTSRLPSSLGLSKAKPEKIPLKTWIVHGKLVLEICIDNLPCTLSLLDSYLYIKPSRLYI